MFVCDSLVLVCVYVCVMSACLDEGVLIHGVKGVEVKGVTLTHTVSYRPGKVVFIKQPPGSDTHINKSDNRTDHNVDLQVSLRWRKSQPAGIVPE